MSENYNLGMKNIITELKSELQREKEKNKLVEFEHRGLQEKLKFQDHRIALYEESEANYKWHIEDLSRKLREREEELEAVKVLQAVKQEKTYSLDRDAFELLKPTTSKMNVLKTAAAAAMTPSKNISHQSQWVPMKNADKSIPSELTSQRSSRYEHN